MWKGLVGAILVGLVLGKISGWIIGESLAISGGKAIFFFLAPVVGWLVYVLVKERYEPPIAIAISLLIVLILLVGSF